MYNYVDRIREDGQMKRNWLTIYDKKLEKAMNELRQRGAFKVPKKCTYSETFYVLAKDKQDAEKKCLESF